jgi:hypothetical protein
VPGPAYDLQCRSGSLYTGITNDLPERLKAHADGKAPVHPQQAATGAGLPATLAVNACGPEAGRDQGATTDREKAVGGRLSRTGHVMPSTGPSGAPAPPSKTVPHASAAASNAATTSGTPSVAGFATTSNSSPPTRSGISGFTTIRRARFGASKTSPAAG